MDGIRQYLLSVTAAAILCAIVKALTDKKGAPTTLIKLISGIFLAITVFAPLTNIDLSNLTDYMKSFTVDADTAAAVGTDYAREETAAIIKAQTEAYILDKASSLGADLQVSVTLSDDTLPVPCAVVITGGIAPYAKERLTRYITDDLNIPEAQQTWT